MKLNVEKTLALLANPNIKWLDLSLTEIHELTIKDFKTLFDALTANTSLRYLGIGFNNLGILPMKRLLMLFTFLEKNTSIIKLSLYRSHLNKMSKEAQAKFFQCFEKNQITKKFNKPFFASSNLYLSSNVFYESMPISCYIKARLTEGYLL